MTEKTVRQDPIPEFEMVREHMHTYNVPRSGVSLTVDGEDLVMYLDSGIYDSLHPAFLDKVRALNIIIRRNGVEITDEEHKRIRLGRLRMMELIIKHKDTTVELVELHECSTKELLWRMACLYGPMHHRLWVKQRDGVNYDY